MSDPTAIEPMKFDSSKHLREYDIQENINIEAFANDKCKFFDCLNFTCLDRKYITSKIILPHINSNFLLQNANDLYIMYARINDSAVRSNEFHVRSFFTEKEITDYQTQVGECHKNYIPIAFAVIPGIKDKAFKMKFHSIELFETIYRGRNFGKLMLSKLIEYFDHNEKSDYVILPRDIDSHSTFLCYQ